jgi:hypothetical protein
MTRRHDRTDDAHERFMEWLLASSDDDPPRDVAVHASVCHDCRQAIAALDMLTAIDPARAGQPPLRSLQGRPLRTATRVAAAVGGVAAVAAIGVGGWRLVDANALRFGAVTESPNQAVLGNTGQPEATLEPSPSASASGSAEDASPSLSPSPSPTPAAPANPGLLPPNPPPASTVPPTARPTVKPTATPQPSIILPTPSPSPQPTPEVTPPPPPTPDPTPTESEPPAAA